MGSHGFLKQVVVFQALCHHRGLGGNACAGAVIGLEACLNAVSKLCLLSLHRLDETGLYLAFDFPFSETSFDFNDELKIASSCFARLATCGDYTSGQFFTKKAMFRVNFDSSLIDQRKAHRHTPNRAVCSQTGVLSVIKGRNGTL
ncbi:hypothetical protein ECG_02840 [Echinococcus granulosus]|nr:hypothetical protein ECG_02840 [Echinococcus granulosus]